jgi:hypothetical protein
MQMRDTYASIDIAVSAFARNKFPLFICILKEIVIFVYKDGSVAMLSVNTAAVDLNYLFRKSRQFYCI